MKGLSRRLGEQSDAKSVRRVRQLAAEDLTTRFGRGHWSSVGTVVTLRKHALAKHLHVVELDGDVVATFSLSPRKIGFYHKSWFANPGDDALYLTNMAVRPAWKDFLS